MPDPTTTNLVLAVPTRGSDVGTWDTPVNGDMQILDACAGNVTTKNVSGQSTINLSTGESQVNIIRFTGTVTQSCIVTLGPIVKSWIIENLTTNNGFILRIIGNTGTGNFIMPPPGSCQIYWDGTNVSFINLGPNIGCYEDFTGSSLPLWISSCSVPPFLVCDGTAYNATLYPLLNAILGGTPVPDLRGRARYALDGGQGRITTAGSGIDGANRFSSGGQQNVNLTTAQMPVHTHGVTDPGHAHTVNDAPSKIGQFSAAGSNGWAANTVVSTGASGTGITIQNTGNGDAHTNMPPAFICGIMMIRAG